MPSTRPEMTMPEMDESVSGGRTGRSSEIDYDDGLADRAGQGRNISKLPS